MGKDMTTSESIPRAPANWAERKLCPDGACMGVAGPDGKCTMCGATVPGAQKGPSSTSEDEVESAPEPETVSETSSAAKEESGSFDQGRKLCPDGACIGLIGKDGKCKVCGTPYRKS